MAPTDHRDESLSVHAAVRVVIGRVATGGREVGDFVVKTFEDVVNDRLDNRSFVLIAGERLTASIDSHTAATTTSVTSPTERTSMFASRNPLSAWSCGPSPRSARCSTCPRPRRSRIPSRHGRQWSVWDSVRVNVQKLVRSSARTSAGAGDRADPDSHLWGWSSSRTTSTASRRSGPPPRRCSRLLTVDRHRRRPSGRGTPVVRRPSSAYPPAPFNSTPSNSNSVAVPGTASSLSRARTSPTLPGSSWKAALSSLNASRLV